MLRKEPWVRFRSIRAIFTIAYLIALGSSSRSLFFLPPPLNNNARPTNQQNWTNKTPQRGMPQTEGNKNFAPNTHTEKQEEKHALGNGSLGQRHQINISRFSVSALCTMKKENTSTDGVERWKSKAKPPKQHRSIDDLETSPWDQTFLVENYLFLSLSLFLFCVLFFIVGPV